MSEIDDIFARLGGGKLSNSEQRDHRDIPRKGKLGGSRVVEVVHVTTRRSGVSPGVNRRTKSGVRAQTWDSGFPTRSAPHPSAPPAQPETAKATAPVGHVITRWEPVAEMVPSPPPAPIEDRHGPVKEPRTRAARVSAKQAARPIADPFNAEDDRANCLRCGYAIQPGRERRGLTICAACAG